jgi:hypothetical protein
MCLKDSNRLSHSHTNSDSTVAHQNGSMLTAKIKANIKPNENSMFRFKTKLEISISLLN